ncbi:MAG: Maf family protein [Planctomycetota bacterium]
MTPERIVLASASPRRRSLLAAAGVRFRVEAAEVDEDLAGATDPVETARELARRKALAVAGRRRGGPAAATTWVVGADTVVALPAAAGWRLLGKPRDAGEAREMLGLLSGSRHRVVTGVCVARADGARELVDSESTWVSMRAIAPEEIAAYVAGGEWRDKAGAYAIQEGADRFVTSLAEGGYDNVVGLPVALTLSLLRQAGAPPGLLGG